MLQYKSTFFLVEHKRQKVLIFRYFEKQLYRVVFDNNKWFDLKKYLELVLHWIILHLCYNAVVTL